MEETKEIKKEKNALEDFAFGINIEELAQAGVHLGHSLSSLHPKMRPFIYGMKNGIYVIDLKKTAQKLEELLQELVSLYKKGEKILFVGTKYQTRDLIKELAQEFSFPYVINRWIGGLLTNFNEVKKRVDYMKELQEGLSSGKYDSYTKLERQKIAQEIEKLKEKFGGVENLEKLPSVIFLLNMDKDILAVKEAKKVGIKILALADTNVDCSLADLFVPANDDSITSVKYILDKVKLALSSVKTS